MAKHTEAAPRLPAASIDFNALHDACRAGKSPEKALAAALLVTAEPDGEPIEEAPLPEGATARPAA